MIARCLIIESPTSDISFTLLLPDFWYVSFGGATSVHPDYEVALTDKTTEVLQIPVSSKYRMNPHLP